jgi:hypothetical protein
MGTHFGLLNQWRHVETISRMTSIIGANWTITKKIKKKNKNPKKI